MSIATQEALRSYLNYFGNQETIITEIINKSLLLNLHPHTSSKSYQTHWIMAIKLIKIVEIL